MTDETTIQADAEALVAMTVADLAAHLDTVDLDTLKAALAAEQAKGDGARRGALAALNAAIDGHPEQAEAAAEAAESEDGTADDAPASEPAPAAADGAIEAAAEPEAPVVAAEEPAQSEAGEPVDELSDIPPSPDAVSAAPPRPHQSLVDQLEIRWFELCDFIRDIEGTVEGDLGALLQFVRERL